MAKKYDNNKGFLVIEMSHKEATEICHFGRVINNTEHHIVCDNCNNLFDKKDNIYYFAVFNRAFCKECTDDIIANRERYEEDISYEVKHYNFYANKLNLEKSMITIDDMTDEDAKEYFEDLSAEYWIDEYKNNPDLM